MHYELWSDPKKVFSSYNGKRKYVKGIYQTPNKVCLSGTKNTSAARKYTLSLELNNCIGAAFIVSTGENKCHRQPHHMLFESCYDITLLVLGNHSDRWTMGRDVCACVCVVISLDLYMIHDDKNTEQFYVNCPQLLYCCMDVYIIHDDMK